MVRSSTRSRDLTFASAPLLSLSLSKASALILLRLSLSALPCKTSTTRFSHRQVLRQVRRELMRILREEEGWKWDVRSWMTMGQEPIDPPARHLGVGEEHRGRDVSPTLSDS